MKRIMAWMLLMLLLMGEFAYADFKIQAAELAMQLSQYISRMEEIQEMPLDAGKKNRAIWSDICGDEKCALIVYSDANTAQNAVLDESTRTTAVRAVENCALYIFRDLGAEVILEYHLALANILGETIDDSEPDYILNESTRRFHITTCRAVDQMNEENKYAYIGDRSELIEHGYDPCGICKP